MGGREMDAFDCHSYYRFTKKMPEDLQECFSMDKTGKRLQAISSSGPGQLCWTSPKMRSEAVRQFDDMVLHERNVTMTGPDYLSLPLPEVWDISQNDNSSYCECPDCTAAAAKYDAKSGAMLEFTNAIASGIRKKYPSFKIQTFAYLGTEKPPKGIVAEPNVIVRLAQLGGEWGTSLMRDSLRPLTHPNNQKALKNLQEWAAVSSKISIWDYWVLYRQLYSFPFSNAKAIAENTKIYSSIGSVKRLRLESELLLGGKLNGNFIDLRYFLAMNLMVDPTLDIQALTAEFMQYYFGPAADTMNQLYLLLDKNMEMETMNLGVSGVNSKYLTSEFFDQSMRLFATAEEQAKDCPEILGHIGQERINFDIPMVYMNGKRGVFPAPGAQQRLMDNYHFIIKKYYDAHDKAKLIGEIDQYIHISLFKMEIPEQFKEKKVIYDMTWNKFPVEVTGWTDMIDDPVSPAGRTRIHSGISPRIGVNALTSPDYHQKDMLFHVFDHKTKKSIELVIPHGELPKDEQYHWFKVGICNLSPGTVLSLHHSKRFEMSLSGGNDPVLGDQECELWVSVKFQGADYVPGSTMQSAVACDRVMLFSTEE